MEVVYVLAGFFTVSQKPKAWMTAGRLQLSAVIKFQCRLFSFFFFSFSPVELHTMSDTEEAVSVEQPVVKKGKTGKYRKEKRKYGET